MEEWGRGPPGARRGIRGDHQNVLSTTPQEDGVPKAGLDRAGGRREGRDRAGVTTATEGKYREGLGNRAQSKESPRGAEGRSRRGQTEPLQPSFVGTDRSEPFID